jgi:uncharacterized protein (TIGR00106 family)
MGTYYLNNGLKKSRNADDEVILPGPVDRRFDRPRPAGAGSAGEYDVPFGQKVLIFGFTLGRADRREERAVLVAFSVTPLGIGEGVGEEVAEAVRVVRESGLPNRTDAMFTTLEGDWDEAMAVVKRAVEAVAARAPRVSLVLKADIRPGVTGALTAKVETVERYLQG